MIETTTREFTRQFPKYRRLAARGETVHISSPEGSFVFTKEAKGLSVDDFLDRISGDEPLFSDEGLRRMEDEGSRNMEAKSPWD
jgi:hypothetical protein